MRWFALLAAVVLGASACGSDGDETAAGEGETASPIAEFLGQDVFSEDEEAAAAQFVEQEQVRQEAIAACMQEQGFEYVAYVPDASLVFGRADEGLEWGSDEWVAKYGFGYTTQWYSQEEVGPDLVGYEAGDFEEQLDDDPNAAIAGALSESEQEAYYAALYGDPDDFPVFDETQSEEEIEAQMEDFAYEPSGCQGEAYAESEDPSNRFYQDFGDELEELYERIQNDPRVVEAEQAVAECVADRGLEYTDEEGVYQQFEDELMEIDSMVDFPGQDLSEEELASMSDEELNALYSQPRELPQEALDKLADLQEREIALAVAVNECGGGFRNAEELYREVSAEHEQEFLDEHADELSDYEAGS